MVADTVAVVEADYQRFIAAVEPLVVMLRGHRAEEEQFGLFGPVQAVRFHLLV